MLALAALLSLSLPLLQEKVPMMAEADHMLGRGQFSQAAEALRLITAADPDNGTAWFNLGYCLHRVGNYSAAAEANRRAAEVPLFRGTALFNLAGELAFLGDLDGAAQAIADCNEDGYLDFDGMRRVQLLEPLRNAGRIPFPPRHEYAVHEAPNGVKLRYALLQPADYDPERTYRALLAFPSGSWGPGSSDWAIAELWNHVPEQSNWIVLCPIVEDGIWFSQPVHRALVDLMRAVKSDHRIEGGRFHAFGFCSGARPATTFARYTRSLIQSLTVVSSYAWENLEDDVHYREYRTMPVHHIVGGAEPYRMGLADRAEKLLAKHGVEAKKTVLPGEGVLVPSLRGAKLFETIEAGLGLSGAPSGD